MREIDPLKELREVKRKIARKFGTVGALVAELQRQKVLKPSTCIATPNEARRTAGAAKYSTVSLAESKLIVNQALRNGTLKIGPDGLIVNATPLRSGRRSKATAGNHAFNDRVARRKKSGQSRSVISR